MPCGCGGPPYYHRTSEFGRIKGEIALNISSAPRDRIIEANDNFIP